MSEMVEGVAGGCQEPAQQQQRICRICYAKEFEEGRGGFNRREVCKCSGARALVHMSCLMEWQRTARAKGQYRAGRVCHACDSEYLVTEEKVAVGVLGGTGLVGRHLAARLADHPLFKLGPVAGSPASVGHTLGEVWTAKEHALEAHYGPSLWPADPAPDCVRDVVVAPVSELETCEYVISAIAPNLGHLEDGLRDAGVAVFSISPHARDSPENPLIVAEANGLGGLVDLVSSPRPETTEETTVCSVAADPAVKWLPLFKSPNCVVCGVSLPLAALDKAFTLREVSVTTFQALSGRGDAKYDPASLVVGNIYPLAATSEKTDAYQRAEIRRLFPNVRKCSVAAQRVPVKNGHYVRVGCSFERPPADIREVTDVLRAFNPLHGLDLPSAPDTPILVVDGVGRPRPDLDSAHSNGMAVAVGDIKRGDAHDLFHLSFAVVLNNLVRGAYGGALLNAELFELYGRRVPRRGSLRGNGPDQYYDDDGTTLAVREDKAPPTHAISVPSPPRFAAGGTKKKKKGRGLFLTSCKSGVGL